MPQTIDLGYRARPQFAPFHARRQRWACLVAHRRAGKTVACVMDLIDAALRCDHPNGRFAYMSPTFSQSKDVAWAYLKRFTAAIPGIDQRESDLTVIFPNGARVRLFGSDNFERLRGTYHDGVVMDEFGDTDPRAWPEVIRPSLADRQGWAVFIGTPKGHNHFYDIHKRALTDSAWFSLVLRADETRIIPPAELADMLATLGPDAYAQELLCSFEAAIRGAVYARELEAARTEGRICSVPHDPAAPCWVSWDIGIGDACALWVAQVVGREIHFIDYYEANGEAIPHYLGWLESKPYRYVCDILPHDARAREKGTGKSVEELIRANGRKVRIAPRLTPDDGVNALRVLFPRLWIDATKCARGLECLAHYRRDYNAKMGVYKPDFVHDWSSHASDSARYMALGLHERLGLTPQAKQPGPSDPWERRLPAAGGGADGRWMGL